MDVIGQGHVPAALPPGNRLGTNYIGGWVGPRAGLDGCGKSRPNGIRSTDRPVLSESLYRLSYPCPGLWMGRSEYSSGGKAQRHVTRKAVNSSSSSDFRLGSLHYGTEVRTNQRLLG